VRMLTHADVTSQDIDKALAAWRTVAADLGAARPVAAH
jgi:hypothetical protein